ncbi:galactose mutarotase [Bacillus sp. BRMEA1]|uniref:aldose epimerase family protein n=1 Tax=Neobacillus endophyticus TaxID=2738405 RepID=UPI001562F7B5|nr:aldose epimerase family protein [Neobacillus endophyticus]NRD77787.1 galactose mutarotase [Neobacillus endophyticus]
MEITKRLFGQIDGGTVNEYTLTNDLGMRVSCLDYGCVITKILAPDRSGTMENVVLGFERLEDYLEWSPYFGTVVGRVAGRIKGARFELDGQEYVLDANEGANHIHGGKKGFDKVVWQAEPLEDEKSVGIKFFYYSSDGEEGYPGNLETTVIYRLTNENELIVTFEAETDKKTLVNLTNHSYFNLNGNLKRDCSGHELQLDNNGFLELASDLIPTGKILGAADTPFDFRSGRKLSDGIQSSDPQNILVGYGYDHPLIFSKQGENKIRLCDDESGRVLEMTTNQPCVVLYSGNQLAGPFSISGVPARKYLGVCLETQGLPDAIHHPEFPSVILNPGELYRHATTYRFFVQ